MPINDSSAYKLRPEPEDEPDEASLGKYVSIELPDEAVIILNKMMMLTGDTTESLFRKSLGLYKIAVDAKLGGNHLAIVDDDDEFVQDIAGL